MTDESESFRELATTFMKVGQSLPGFLFKVHRDAGGEALTLSYISANVETHFGIRPEQVEGQDALIMLGEAAPLFRELAKQSAETGELIRLDTAIPTLSGVQMRAEIIAVPEALEDGSTLFSGLCVDVSDTALVSEQRERARRAEAVGRLAGAVAEEFRSLLDRLEEACGQAQAAGANRGALSRAMGVAKDLTSRAGTLTDTLLAFARPEMGRAEEFDANEAVKSLATELRHLDSEASISVELGAEPLLIRADPALLGRALLSLVMRTDGLGGEAARGVLIRARRIELDERSAQLYSGVAAGPCLLLSIADLGRALDASERHGLVAPSSIESLPLAASHRTIRQCGGDVQVDSQKGLGTRFDVVVPLVAPRTIETASTAALDSGSDTVVLVEDDPLLRKLVKIELEQSGFRVVPAGDGDSAIRAAESQEQLALVISDYVMPGPSGGALVSRLRQRHPEVPILFMSGYHWGVDEAGSDGISFLAKPFTPKELAAAVRDILGID